MSDKIKGFYVSLEEDIHEDDYELLKSAILMMRYVSNVEHFVSNVDDWMARSRIKQEFQEKLRNIVF